MKKIIAAGLLVLIFSCHEETGIIVGSPLPKFDILLLDSSVLKTVDLPSGKYTVFMYFRPDCIYCQKETNDIVINAASLQNIQIIFLTPKPLSDIRLFADYYKLGSFSNFRIASDNKLGFLRYFHPPGIPFLVVYDKENNFKEAFAGGVSIDSLRISLSL